MPLLQRDFLRGCVLPQLVERLPQYVLLPQFLQPLPYEPLRHGVLLRLYALLRPVSVPLLELSQSLLSALLQLYERLLDEPFRPCAMLPDELLRLF